MDVEGSITAYLRELHYTGICLEDLMKPIKHFREESWLLNCDIHTSFKLHSVN
jgi:hypothetical protein